MDENYLNAKHSNACYVLYLPDIVTLDRVKSDAKIIPAEAWRASPNIASRISSYTHNTSSPRTRSSSSPISDSHVNIHNANMHPLPAPHPRPLHHLFQSR